jgi:signal peptidase I
VWSRGCEMRKKRILIAILLPIAVAMALVFLYSLLFLTFVRVPTGAMKNTIAIGDHLVANRITGRIQRADIVIFKYPRDPRTTYVKRVIALPGETIHFDPETGIILINGKELPEHRIRAVYQAPDDPGQLEEKTEEGAPPGSAYSVYYQQENDTGADARYGVGQLFRVPKKGDPMPEDISTSDYRNVYDADHDGRYDSDQYFCMGDNRDNSEDSRYWGTVPAGLIVGKAFAIYWSQEPAESGGHIRWNRIFKKLE